MKTEELSGGKLRVYLNRFEFLQLLRCSHNETANIAMQLAGESGLRVSEMMNVKLSHIKESNVADEFYFLHIPLTEEDENKNYARGRPRDAVLPNHVLLALDSFADENDINQDESIFDLSKRTIQDYIKRSGKRAAEVTGESGYLNVSASDLRIFFAKQSIDSRHIHPNVVMEVGGWGEFDNLHELLNPATEDLIVREFERARKIQLQSSNFLL